MSKKYIGTIACRDGKKRTVTIEDTTTTGDNTDLIISGISIEMSSEDTFTPLRKTTGTITVINTNGQMTAENFKASSATSHKVSIVRDDGVTEFLGYVALDTYTQDWPNDGENYGISVVSCLTAGDAIPLDLIDFDDYMPYNEFSVAEIIRRCAIKLGLNSSVILPKLWGQSVSGVDTPYGLWLSAYNTIKENETDERDEDWTYWQSLSVAEVLMKIAKFYFITFCDFNGHLVATRLNETQHYVFPINGDEPTTSSIGYADFSNVKMFDAQQSLVAAPKKVAYTEKRDKVGEHLVSGTSTADYKWKAGGAFLLNPTLGSDSRTVSAWTYEQETKDGMSNAVSFSSTTISNLFCWGAKPCRLERSGEYGDQPLDADGFSVFLYKNGVQIPENAGEIKTIPCITLKSKGIYTTRKSSIVVSMKALATKRTGSTSYKSVSLSDEGYHTYVSVRLKIGNRVIGTNKLTFEEGDSYWKSATGKAKFYIGPFEDEEFLRSGVITADVYVGKYATDTNTPECYFVHLYDISITFGQYDSYHDYTQCPDNIDGDVRWSKTINGQTGDAYEVESDIMATEDTKDLDFNVINTFNGKPFTGVNGINWPQYQMLSVYSCMAISRSELEMELPIGTLEDEAGVDVPLLSDVETNDGTNYYVVAVSRDYGEGTEKLKLASKPIQ